MEVKSTLRVVHQADYPGKRGVIDKQNYQRLVGWPGVVDTERIRIGRATYKPGAYEQLHWHPIEACSTGPIRLKSSRRPAMCGPGS